MKKILIIANLDHASPRIPGLTNYFSDFGWQVTVLCAPCGENSEIRLGFPDGFLERVNIIEVPFCGDVFWIWRRLLKRIGFKTDESMTEQLKERVGAVQKKSYVDLAMYLYQTFFAFPDTDWPWRKPALRAARQLLRKKHFEAILSTSPFPTNHRVAVQLKREFGFPWVADFRDTWTQNPEVQFPKFRKMVEIPFEVRTIAGADAVVTVSKTYANDLRSLHKKTIHVIPNGFNFPTPQSAVISLTKKFTITYTGKIYPQQQDSQKFLEALKELIDARQINPDDVEVRFYGRKIAWLQDTIKNLGLGNKVGMYGIIPRKHAFIRQKESQLLLFLGWGDQEKGGLSHLKFYEYLAAQRPILVSGGYSDSEYVTMLDETSAGVFGETKKEIKTALVYFYRQYKKYGHVPYAGDIGQINKYSYWERAKDYCRILDECVLPSRS